MKQTPANIIIDGYNVIGIQHRDLEAARESFIEALIEYRKRTGHNITVVFDAWRTGAARASQSTTGGVTVIYSAHGEKADTRIKKIISGYDAHWIVVTSDRDIQIHAWSKGSVPIGSELFLTKLEGPLPGGEYEPIEEDYEGPRKKGRARQPSKKQKAIDRALKKL
jgi:predicted RNA-binding protein with PIN domain